MAEVIATRIYTDPDILSEQNAGASRLNYLLKGLGYKLTVKTAGVIRAVYLYSSDTFGDLGHRFDFILDEPGVYVYEGVAGADATADAVCQAVPNWNYGVKFFFHILIVGENLDYTIDRILWVRDATDVILFETEQLPYQSPYPVLIGNLAVPCLIAPNAKNAAGVVNYGGVVTVEIFDDPLALSAGAHVTTVAETAVADIAEITLADRTAAGGIDGFIPPPGAPDFSMFYHFIVFRLRAKALSTTYRDIAVILFAARKCKGEDGTYGYDSTGEVLPVPTPADPLALLGPPFPLGPPPVCSSKTTLTTSNLLNPYSQQTKVMVYDQAVGGSLVAEGIAVRTGDYTLEVYRRDMGGDTAQPISGWYQISEAGPDRLSDRSEGATYGCTLSPADPLTIINTENLVKITTTPGSAVLDPLQTYTIKAYDAKYGGTLLDTYTGIVTGDHELTFTITGDLTAWLEILLGSVVISAPRVYAELVVVVPDNVKLTTLAGEKTLIRINSTSWGLSEVGLAYALIWIAGLGKWRVAIGIPETYNVGYWDGPSNPADPTGNYNFLFGIPTPEFWTIPHGTTISCEWPV